MVDGGSNKQRETKAQDAIVEEPRAKESRNSNAVLHRELKTYNDRSTKKVNIKFDKQMYSFKVLDGTNPNPTILVKPRSLERRGALSVKQSPAEIAKLALRNLVKVVDCMDNQKWL